MIRLARSHIATEASLKLRAHRREIENSCNAERPSHRPASVGQIEARCTDMHVSPTTWQSYVVIRHDDGTVVALDRHKTQQGFLGRLDPTTHTRAHRLRGADVMVRAAKPSTGCQLYLSPHGSSVGTFRRGGYLFPPQRAGGPWSLSSRRFTAVMDQRPEGSPWLVPARC